MKRKMNGLYKAAFILLLVCLLLFVASIIVAYLLKMPKTSAVFSCGGAFLAFLGIIFAGLSKPKKIKSKDLQENPENILDNQPEC